MIQFVSFTFERGKSTNLQSVLGMALVPKRTANECYVLAYGDNPNCHVLEIKL